jgi:8-oxo-dGTP pyrophosphatase MutT (NUDIX family)
MSSTASTIVALAQASDLPQQIAGVLSEGRQGGAGRSRMSPEMSYGRHAGPAPHTARRAAVMLLLFRRAGRWHLPLTERPATLARHAGQISLPGGSANPGETTSQTALRELREELGVSDAVDFVGQLAECYVFATDFRVTPWVAAADFVPCWKPLNSEVQRVVELPLETLFDERSIGRTTIERGPLLLQAPCLRVDGACIWGATSVILAELADLLKACLTQRREKRIS